MKEFIIYDSVKKGREWVDLIVMSRFSFKDAEEKFLERVKENGFLEVSGVHGCTRRNGRVTAWYKYDHSRRAWIEVREPVVWERWKAIIES